MSKVMTLTQAVKLAKEVRGRGMMFQGWNRLVTTNGCFSVLHVGHVDLLQNARKLGGCLIVLVNSDKSLPKHVDFKSIVTQSARAKILAALSCVDAVVIFDEPNPIRALSRLRPDIHVKGGDYNANELPEKDIVHKHGGCVVTIAHKHNESSSRIIARAKKVPPKH